MLSPRVTDLGQDVRLDWTPDPTGQGYRFYVDGHAVSRSFNPAQSSITFRKPDGGTHSYGLRLMAEVGALEAASFPVPTPPAEGDLPFALPDLVNPVRLTVPVDRDFTLPSTTVGKDVELDFQGREGVVRQYALILDNSGGPPRNMVLRNGHSRCTKPSDSSGYRHGGIKVQTQAQKAAILDWFDERRGVAGCTAVDGIGIASETYTEWTVQRCLIEGQSDGAIPAGQHVDALQLQGPIGKLRVGLCSFDLAGIRPGNDPGKGLQLAEEPWQEDPETRFSVEIEKLDVECRGNPATGARYGVLLVQEYARDTIALGPEVYWSRDASLDPLGDNFGVTLYTNGRPGDYGVVAGTRPNRTLTARTSSGISGVVRERPSGSPRFVTRQMLGYA